MATKLQIQGGKLFIEVYAADGTLGKQISFGSTDEISMNTDVEKIQHYDSEGSEQVLDGDHVTSRTVGLNFQTADISGEMLGRAYLGNTSTITQTAVTDEALTATGVIAGGRVNTGYRNVSSMIVKNSGDTVTYVEGEDYEFIPKGGYIVIIDGGDIADESDINLTFSAPDGTGVLVDAMKQDALEVRLTFSGSASVGESNEYVFEKVSLSTSGDTTLKGKEYTKINFEGSALKTNGKYFTVETY